MITLHADPITVNCRKVLAGLALMDVPFELKHVDYFKGEQKSPEYLAVNPNASLPAMTDGDYVLWESNAVLQYAADLHGKADHYPGDLKTRCDINRWLQWEGSHWFPSCYVFLVENCVKPLLGGAPDPAVLEGQLATFHKLAAILDARLARHQWIAGTPHPTIADIALAAPMHLHGWQKLPIEGHANLCRWMRDIEALPSWQKTWVGEGFTTQKPQ